MFKNLSPERRGSSSRSLGGALPWLLAPLVASSAAYLRNDAFSFITQGSNPSFPSLSPYPESERLLCRPFLPRQLLIDHPPSRDHPRLTEAWSLFQEYLDQLQDSGSFDTIAVAVVTAAKNDEGKGVPLFSDVRGRLRSNESTRRDPSAVVDIHSQYRIASTGKLTALMIGWIMSEKGIISWEDPVTKYIPSFTPHPSAGNVVITLLDLATHMSGLGRDWPPGEPTDWPYGLDCAGAPPDNCHPFPSPRELLDSIAANKLVSAPWTEPQYSNTASGLLPLVLLEASKRHYGKDAPQSVAELARREIFEPLGMVDSHYLATKENKEHIVVPAYMPDVVDQDFLDAMNGPGGQFSSLYDMVRMTQAILDPSSFSTSDRTAILSQKSVDRWLKPVVAFEEDDWTELGMTWEIIKHADSRGRLRRVYWKLGLMNAFGACLAIHPGTSYGVTVLMTKNHPDAAMVCYKAFDLFQPAIDAILDDLATELYVGNWKGLTEVVREGQKKKVAVQVVVSLHRGTLFIDAMRFDNVDMMQYFGSSSRGPETASQKLALRSTGRDEFRIDLGFAGFNGHKHMGCYTYWNGKDTTGNLYGVSTNVLSFFGPASDRELYIPSLDVTLKRAK